MAAAAPATTTTAAAAPGPAAGVELDPELAELDAEQRQLAAGTHPALLARRAALDMERRDRVERAELQRRWQMHVADQHFEYEQSAATQLFEEGLELARKDLQQQLEDRLRMLRSRSLDGRGPHRTLRSQVKDAGPAVDLTPPDPTVYPLRFALAREDIMDDLRAIFSDWKQAAQRFQMQTTDRLLPTRADNNVLHHFSDSFRRGDAVVVVSELTVQEFHGVFLGATAVEAAIQLDDGTRCRLPLPHLRMGRLTIRRATEPDAAAAQLLDSLRRPQFPDVSAVAVAGPSTSSSSSSSASSAAAAGDVAKAASGGRAAAAGGAPKARLDTTITTTTEPIAPSTTRPAKRARDESVPQPPPPPSSSAAASAPPAPVAASAFESSQASVPREALVMPDQPPAIASEAPPTEVASMMLPLLMPSDPATEAAAASIAEDASHPVHSAGGDDDEQAADDHAAAAADADADGAGDSKRAKLDVPSGDPVPCANDSASGGDGEGVN